jgi:hypothetical protein
VKVADRLTEDDLHQEAVRNGEIEGVICQRCPWCPDPGLPDGETAFGVAEVNLDDPRPVGCDVNHCVNVIGYVVNSESCWEEGFEALDDIEALGTEALGDTGRAEQFLEENGVWSWYSSGGDTPGLGWTATYYCEEDKHRDSLKTALIAEKADLEKTLADLAEEEDEGEEEEEEYDWFTEEGSDDEEDEEDEQAEGYDRDEGRVNDETEPHTDDNHARRKTDVEIRTMLDSRDDPGEPTTMFWLYECGLVTDEIFVYSRKGCPRCGNKHPLRENVTARVLQTFRSQG